MVADQCSALGLSQVDQILETRRRHIMAMTYDITRPKAVIKVADGQTQPFPFEKFPLEIRRMVLKELLVMPTQIYLGSQCIPFAMQMPIYEIREDYKEWWDVPPKFLWPDEFPDGEIRQSDVCQIFLTSSSIYHEAVPIYYGLNTFQFAHLNRFEHFATKLGAYSRWQVAKISLKFCGTAPARAAKILSSFVGIRELKLYLDTCWLHHIGSGKSSDLHFCGHKDLLRVRGLNDLQVNICSYIYNGYLTYGSWSEKEKIAIVEGLDVLKQPHDEKTLKRQEAKDFPQRGQRTVFGRSNVTTRAERKSKGGEFLDV